MRVALLQKITEDSALQMVLGSKTAELINDTDTNLWAVCAVLPEMPYELFKAEMRGDTQSINQILKAAKDIKPAKG